MPLSVRQTPGRLPTLHVHRPCRPTHRARPQACGASRKKVCYLFLFLSLCLSFFLLFYFGSQSVQDDAIDNANSLFFSCSSFCHLSTCQPERNDSSNIPKRPQGIAPLLAEIMSAKGHHLAPCLFSHYQETFDAQLRLRLSEICIHVCCFGHEKWTGKELVMLDHRILTSCCLFSFFFWIAWLGAREFGEMELAYAITDGTRKLSIQIAAGRASRTLVDTGTAASTSDNARYCS